MRYMLTFTWKQALTEEIMALIPAEQARGRELEEQGIREAFYAAADLSMFWAVWQCESEAEVQRIAETFPMYGLLNFDVTPLTEELPGSSE